METELEKIIDQATALLRGKILQLEEDEKGLTHWWQLVKSIKISGEIIRILNKMQVLLSLKICHIRELEKLAKIFYMKEQEK